MTRNINLIPIDERIKGIARLGGNSIYLSQTFPNPLAGRLPGTPLNAATLTRNDLLRPNPLFQGINQDFNNIGWSSYKALEMALNKRLSHGLLANVTYTWSQRLQATTLLNPYDEKPFEDLDPNDRPQRVTITALYNLPFGPGQRFGGNTTGLVARLIEGWQYNIIGEISSGTPIGMNGNAVPVGEQLRGGRPVAEQVVRHAARARTRGRTARSRGTPTSAPTTSASRGCSSPTCGRTRSRTGRCRSSRTRASAAA